MQKLHQIYNDKNVSFKKFENLKKFAKICKKNGQECEESQVNHENMSQKKSENCLKIIEKPRKNAQT